MGYGYPTGGQGGYGGPTGGQGGYGGGYGGQPGGGGTPPDNYLVWSILSTICCCLPLGIVSIVFSTQVNSKWQAGDYAGAQDASNKAKNFAIWSAVAGVIAGVLYAILYFFVFAASMATAPSYY
ncbi:CD225/dispanin family protein [Allonocardiopsis opalescens]|uniref:Interferon-induced transmembrane protein n=1 Tax=Allonocardiopsis opalescens TaxID=1144618 RepID=A0A2T0Q3Z4_9ACTN|nr:CD225/dispanin family protein [Allonocardiopsis opalescens]PRX98525.1 interferon-induced transmembrane protein [Allonocardiopsis opalescens]